jgi:hypothetical protein
LKKPSGSILTMKKALTNDLSCVSERSRRPDCVIKAALFMTDKRNKSDGVDINAVKQTG